MHKQQLKRLGLAMVLWLIVIGFLFTTNPRDLPIILLIVPFGLLFTAIFFTIRLFVRRFLPRVEKRRQTFIAVAVAGAPTFLLILSSINQLTWRDAFLALLLVGFGLFYGSRLSFLKH